MKFLPFPALPFCLLCCFTDPACSQDTYAVYPKPMRGQKTDGQLLTEATIVYKGVEGGREEVLVFLCPNIL